MAGLMRGIFLAATLVAMTGCAGQNPLSAAAGGSTPDTPDGAVTSAVAQPAAPAATGAASQAATSTSSGAMMGASSTGGVATLASTGGIALKFNLQSLPAGTSKVTVTVSSPALSAPINQTITSSQFVNGVAEMNVSQMPVGSVTVSATAYDASGNSIGSGTSTGQIVASQTTDIQLVLMITGETGNLAIGVDSQTATANPVVSIP